MPPKRKSTTSESTTPVVKKEKKANGVEYAVDETALCSYGKLFYEVKILEVDPQLGYLIHYQGWNKRFDGYISYDEAPTRLKKGTSEALEEAKDAQKHGAKKAAVQKTPKGKVSKAQTGRSRRSSTVASETDSKTSMAKDSPRPRMKLFDKVKTEKEASSTPKPSKVKKEVQPQNGSAKRKQREPISRVDLYGKLLTPDLADVLMEDHELVNRRHKLPKLPGHKSVYQIVDEYCASKDIAPLNLEKFMNFTTAANMADPTSLSRADCCVGLINVFDACVSQVLIYPFERERLEELNGTEGTETNENTILRLSKFLGVTYLLRMFSRLNDILRTAGINSERSEIILDTCHDLAEFVGDRLGELYDVSEYYTQPASNYLQRNSAVTV